MTTATDSVAELRAQKAKIAADLKALKDQEKAGKEAEKAAALAKLSPAERARKELGNLGARLSTAALAGRYQDVIKLANEAISRAEDAAKEFPVPEKAPAAKPAAKK